MTSWTKEDLGELCRHRAIGDGLCECCALEALNLTKWREPEVHLDDPRPPCKRELLNDLMILAERVKKHFNDEINEAIAVAEEEAKGDD